MLKQRIFTALILIPIFIALVLKLPPVGFCTLTGVLMLWAAYEWSSFMGVTTSPRSFIYPLLILVLMIGVLLISVVPILYVAAVWWCLALFLVLLYPKASSIWGKSMMVQALMGIFVLIPCWVAINFIRNAENGTYTLLFLFVLIWGADTGAYFAGRSFGKNKLAPLVSPGKTWEGLAGALSVTILIAFAAFYVFKVPSFIWVKASILTVITVLVSVLGDLFESMLKRNAGLKDSGRLLPGHGGILDRIDSLTAAAPIFTLGALFI